MITLIRKKGSPYEDRLKLLKLTTLEGRKRGDAIETFKIFNVLTDIKAEALYNISDTEKRRGHKFKLSKCHATS